MGPGAGACKRIAIVNSCQARQVDLCPQLLDACGRQLLGLRYRVCGQTGSEILGHIEHVAALDNPKSSNVELRTQDVVPVRRGRHQGGMSLPRISGDGHIFSRSLQMQAGDCGDPLIKTGFSGKLVRQLPLSSHFGSVAAGGPSQPVLQFERR